MNEGLLFVKMYLTNDIGYPTFEVQPNLFLDGFVSIILHNTDNFKSMSKDFVNTPVKTKRPPDKEAVRSEDVSCAFYSAVACPYFLGDDDRDFDESSLKESWDDEKKFVNCANFEPYARCLNKSTSFIHVCSYKEFDDVISMSRFVIAVIRSVFSSFNNSSSRIWCFHFYFDKPSLSLITNKLYLFFQNLHSRIKFYNALILKTGPNSHFNINAHNWLLHSSLKSVHDSLTSDELKEFFLLAAKQKDTKQTLICSSRVVNDFETNISVVIKVTSGDETTLRHQFNFIVYH